MTRHRVCIRYNAHLLKIVEQILADTGQERAEFFEQALFDFALGYAACPWYDDSLHAELEEVAGEIHQYWEDRDRSKLAQEDQTA